MKAQTIALAAVLALLLALPAVAAPTTQAQVTRQAVAALSAGGAAVLTVGTVRNVVTVHVESSDLTGGTSYSVTYLDLNVEATGGTPAYTQVRFDCTGRESACAALRQGDKVLALGKFARLKSGYVDETSINLQAVALVP